MEACEKVKRRKNTPTNFTMQTIVCCTPSSPQLLAAPDFLAHTADSNFTLWLLLVFLPELSGWEEFVGLCLKGLEENILSRAFNLK